MITECVPYGEAEGLPSAEAVGKILPKSGKYQDDRLPLSQEYYYALMRAFARVAAADKRGAFDSVVDFFAPGKAPVAARLGGGGVSESRRQMQAKRASANFDKLVEFATVVAPNLLPCELSDLAFLQQTKQECVECARYFEEVRRRTAHSSRHPRREAAAFRRSRFGSSRVTRAAEHCSARSSLSPDRWTIRRAHR